MTSQLVLETEGLYDLEDVNIETVGLVTRGANRQQFFLLKSDKGGSNAAIMPDEPTTVVSDAISDESTELIAKSFWTKLRDFVRGEVAKANVPEDNIGKSNEDEKKENSNASLSTPAEDVPIAKQATEEAPAPPVALTPETPSGEPEVIINMPENTSDITTLEKADLLARLEKAESELKQAREEKERQVFITKAQSRMSDLPCNPTELADQLYFIAKTDSKRAEWWEANLVAWSNILNDASLFVEKGTSAPSEVSEPVAKAAASADPKAALLAVKPADAWRYVAERQQATK